MHLLSAYCVVRCSRPWSLQSLLPLESSIKEKHLPFGTTGIQGLQSLLGGYHKGW